MIILDMNQISVASLMMNMHMTKSDTVDEDMVRHMILNSVRMYRMMFTEEYGEVVFAWDSRHYWRRDYFPEYKLNRKMGREKDSRDWDQIYGVLNKIKDEVRLNLPYKYLEVYGAEADDIIAVLCKKYQSENIVIVSADKDFIQLHKYPKVKQYTPNTKNMVNGVDPNVYIKEHVLKGDSSDGIPNVLSPDNTFVDGLRQKPLGKKKIGVMLQTNFDELHDEVKRNYQRNEKLIHLDNVPDDLELKILREFDSAPCGDRSKLLNYFISSKLKTLTESIGEF